MTSIVRLLKFLLISFVYWAVGALFIAASGAVDLNTGRRTACGFNAQSMGGRAIIPVLQLAARQLEEVFCLQADAAAGQDRLWNGFFVQQSP